MSKKNNSMLYIFFYLIFSIWLWRILFGLGIGLGIGFNIGTHDLSKAGIIMVWIMVMCTGWWVAYFPALMTTRCLKKVFIRQ